MIQSLSPFTLRNSDLVRVHVCGGEVILKKGWGGEDKEGQRSSLSWLELGEGEHVHRDGWREEDWSGWWIEMEGWRETSSAWIIRKIRKADWWKISTILFLLWYGQRAPYLFLLAPDYWLNKHTCFQAHQHAWYLPWVFIPTSQYLSLFHLNRPR